MAVQARARRAARARGKTPHELTAYQPPNNTVPRAAAQAAGKHTKAPCIDVLAYSAGAQIASPALARLGTAQPGETREQLRARLRLKQIYHAAPDIDTRRFAHRAPGG